MIHDFLPALGRQAKLIYLKAIIYDLVQVKRLGAIFITDLEIGKQDIYADWSSFWHDFIGIVAQANGTADTDHTDSVEEDRSDEENRDGFSVSQDR